MKQPIKYILAALACVAGIGLLAAATSPSASQVNLAPHERGDAIVGPLLMSDATTNLTAGQKVRIPVHPGMGLSITPVAVGLGSTNTGVSGLFFKVATDARGTNFSTTTPIIKTFSGNGTTAVRGFISIADTELVGITAIQVATITNAAVNLPGLIISNLSYTIPY